MQPNSARLARLRLARASLVLLAALASVPAQAATLYWDGSGAAWNTVTSWSTDSGATTPDPSAAPTASDDAVFNISTVSANQTIGLGGANQAANSLTFNSTGTVTLGGGGNRDLSIGAGGITVASEAGAATIGSTTSGLNVFTRIVASQTWTNNSASLLRAVNAASAAPTGNTPVTLTISNTNVGQMTFSNQLNNGAAGAVLSLVIDSSGTGATNVSGGSYSGGTTIKRGVLQTASASIGAGNVKIGDTSGNGDATLRINTTTAITTHLVVQSGSTGAKTLEFVANNVLGGTYNGNITLDGDLTLGIRNVAGGATINGVLSGSGDLIKGQYQGSGTTGGLTLTGVNTYSGDTLINHGAFTLADNAALTFYIGANGVNNKVVGAGTNAAAFNGDFIFDLAGASLVDGNSWQIVDVGTLNESFSGTFFVQGFSETDNVWTNGTGFSFSEATGLLSYTASSIPEPSAFAALAGLGSLGLGLLRRRRRAAA